MASGNVNVSNRAIATAQSIANRKTTGTRRVADNSSSRILLISLLLSALSAIDALLHEPFAQNIRNSVQQRGYNAQHVPKDDIAPAVGLFAVGGARLATLTANAQAHSDISGAVGCKRWGRRRGCKKRKESRVRPAAAIVRSVSVHIPRIKHNEENNAHHRNRRPHKVPPQFVLCSEQELAQQHYPHDGAAVEELHRGDVGVLVGVHDGEVGAKVDEGDDGVAPNGGADAFVATRER